MTWPLTGIVDNLSRIISRRGLLRLMVVAALVVVVALLVVVVVLVVVAVV